MRISRVIIRNWRSVKDADFEPADMTILVGANNAGKTNILSAINFLMGDRWPMPGNLLDSDFYLSDRRREIFIQPDFEDAPYSRLVFDTSRERYVFQAYDRHGQAVRGGFDNDERARLAFAYVDASRSFDRQFGASRWSLFGQAVRFLHDDLLRSGSDRLPQLRALLDQAHSLLKTDLYTSFESALRGAFVDQLRTSRYDVQFQFRTIDETNLYRSLYPTLIERGAAKSPGEAGSGVRNLLVLALFHAFARAFKGGAILGIEEPELFLHPHAQRSLMAQFEGLVADGNQLFISTHSAAFLDITRPERVVVVECCPDDEDEVCTQVRTTTAAALLAARKQLHPDKPMTVASMRAFLRNVRTAEMAEPYFARLVIVAEGPSEREALPLLCAHLGLRFDDEGVSIVAANGKTAIDTLIQVYRAHKIPTYVIFDNDMGARSQNPTANRVICRLLGIDETDTPPAQVTENHAVLAGDWETQTKGDLETIEAGLYNRLDVEARQALGIGTGKNKPLIARYVAEQLLARDIMPAFVADIARCLKQRLGLHLPPDTALANLDEVIPWIAEDSPVRGSLTWKM
ncbi:ATP-dependent nuclease [Limobrevibacterium gyesilva]|uniref:AAA family ATPase n=1 Tax=Limobrevibacterium gyesilva TaxID=2991712 RepID=A0AA41YLV0_9PROT|nr:AAA family ATPase [Limobrevibacterium gyesilva]MCW3476264.1 AAA family ATPase [Limobrevibacterium gyesilva]